MISVTVQLSELLLTFIYYASSDYDNNT